MRVYVLSHNHLLSPSFCFYLSTIFLLLRPRNLSRESLLSGLPDGDRRQLRGPEVTSLRLHLQVQLHVGLHSLVHPAHRRSRHQTGRDRGARRAVKVSCFCNTHVCILPVGGGRFQVQD